MLLDMVPNRRHPFATEINLGEVISQALPESAVGGLPFRLRSHHFALPATR